MPELVLHLNLLFFKLPISVDGPVVAPKTSELTSMFLYLHAISKCQVSIQYIVPSPSCLLFSITSTLAQTILIISLLLHTCLSVISSPHNQNHPSKQRSWSCTENPTQCGIAGGWTWVREGERVWWVWEQSPQPCRARRAKPTSFYSCIFTTQPHFVKQLLENATRPCLCSEEWKERGLLLPCTSEGSGAKVRVSGLGLVGEARTQWENPYGEVGPRDTKATILPS